MDEDTAREAYERMAETGNDSIMEKRQAYLDVEQSFFAVRHRFLDDFILNKCGEFTRIQNPPEVIQVVNLARYFIIMTTIQKFARSHSPLIFLSLEKKWTKITTTSGFDSRAFRLPFPSNTKFYELDRQEVLDYKQKRVAEFPTIKPTCAAWICVAVDLVSDNWEEKLIEKGK